MASTDPANMGATLVNQAARGILPPWAVLSERRRAHVERVVALLDEWALALGLSDAERERWRAAGWLHDSLRDADADQLRHEAPPHLRDLPALLLHGPVASARLGDAVDEELRRAICYHTLGHPELGQLGRALYLADFLEPGRDFEIEWRARLRARMPHETDAVLVEVIAARIAHLLDIRKPIRPETAAFWSAVVSQTA